MIVDRVMCVYEIEDYAGEKRYKLVRVITSVDIENSGDDDIFDAYRPPKYCCVIREIKNTFES